MNKVTQMGIWMDHSNAFLMELSNGTITNYSVCLDFPNAEKESALSKNENVMHNKEKQHQSVYYKKISDILRDFDEVVLFGPTDAKSELLNLLKEDHRFDDVNIKIKNSDKMTAIQMHAFVIDYFKK
jgi:ssDNA-specific exonuclease RecJ